MNNRSKYLIALVAALALFPVGLDSMIVNVAIVPIGRALHTSVDVVQWIVIGYLLANAAVTPLSGYLGNRLGVKRIFLLGIVLFTLFSFLCGIAADQTWLVVFRVLQGIGGGLLLPLGAAVALAQFPEQERAKGMAAVALPILLAPVLGPIVGGLIIDSLGWQAIFFVNVPVGAIALLLNWRILPADAAPEGRARGSFDILGLALAMAGVVLVVYAFKLVSQVDPSTRTALRPEGTIYGWSYWLVWVLLGVGLALLAAFTIHSLRSDDPVVDLRLFRDRRFSLSNLAQWIQATLTFGTLFLIPVYLQQVRLPNLSPLHTGLALLPLGLATIVGMALSARLYRPVGVRLLVATGGALTAISFWQLSDLGPATSIGDLSPWLALIGLSTTMLALPTQTLALQALTGEALNKATSLVTAGKLLFGAIGPAVLVTFFEQQTIWHAGRLSAGALAHHAAGAQTRAILAAQAGTSALHDVFVVLAYVSLVIIVLAMFLPGREATAPAEATQPRGQEREALPA
jgi:EmrB/QacA subfamily drug resistance transporter